MADVQPCSGCGAMSDTHPIVGVTRDEDGRMAKFPVCYQCWVNPEHRQHKLKMHFFDPRQGDVAVDAAERNVMVEGGNGS